MSDQGISGLSAAVQERNAKVLAAAIEEAKDVGFQWITREAVAMRAGVSVGGVNNAYGTMRDLKRAVLREAVAQEIVVIVAQGLADRHEIALSAPPALKEAAAAALTA